MPKENEAPQPQPTAEPSAQPHPDSAVLIGGPGQEPVETGERTAEAPQLQKVKVGGREFELTPEIAEAVRQREADYEKGIQRQGQELAQLRQATQEWQRVRQALVPEKTVSLGTKLFEDPDGALKEYQERILTQVRQEYAQVESTKQFWSDFYEKHQDLKSAKRVVQAVFQENLPRLANASIPQAMEEIASLSRTEVLSVIKAFNGGRSQDTETPSRAVVESPSGPRQPKPKEEESKFKSLGDVIKARRAARRAPARKET